METVVSTEYLLDGKVAPDVGVTPRRPIFELTRDGSALPTRTPELTQPSYLYAVTAIYRMP